MDPHDFLAAEHARLDEQARCIDAARGDARLAFLAQYVIDLEIHQQLLDDVFDTRDEAYGSGQSRCPQEAREQHDLASSDPARNAQTGRRMLQRRQDLERQYLGQEWSVTR